LATEWKARLGLSDAKIAAKLDVDPSTVSNNIADRNRSLKVQRAIAALLAKQSDGAVTEEQFLISVYPEPKHTAATRSLT
jgi:hypothetical protein